ncbi:MAG TPA: DPP IV N-terminal domain-containing protein, partial [Saprospiraceae bacterium]|nr:DPP IV N-terminal domain-containing protein [Saprospiraceae bacterium]
MSHLCPAWARFCAALFLLSFLLPPSALLAQKSITLEDIWQNGTFSAKGVPGFNFQRDGVHFTKLSGSALEQYDLRTGERSAVLLDAAALSSTEAGWQGRFDGYSFSRDESKLLLAVGTQSIYRWSTQAQYFVYDFGTKKITALHNGPKQRYATFSPDGSKVAFVVENDLYFKDLVSGKTTRVTQDGKVNEIINGASDWVYEEEFELVRAFEWSPDGQRLAYLRFDERAVPEFTMEMYRDSAYPEWVTFKYPKVGEPNASVSAHIYTLRSGSSSPIQVPAPSPEAAVPADSYLPRIAWTPANQLCLTWMNRHQNHLRLLLADPATGRCATLLEEKNKYYLDLHDITFLADGSGFVMQSEKSGYNHLYRYDMDGRQVAALTQGDFDVTAFYGLDEKNGLAYYQAAAKNPMQRELYSVKLSGKGQKKISKEPGTHSAQHSGTFDYYVDSYSTLNSPPRYTVRNRKGKVLRELEQNQALAAKQQEYGTIAAEFLQVPIAPGAGPEGPLNAFLIRPTAPQFQGKKLPVLM